MNWFHKVDIEWLKARQGYLSATDVKKLLPTTPTGRPRGNLTEAYLKVWADKQREILEDDTVSVGVMARGHMLEKYALAEFNKLGVMDPLYHWDDCLIHNGDCMAFSPDSLDLEQEDDGLVSMINLALMEDVRYMGEVKAYSTDKHYAVGLAKDKMELEERWQLATAFYVLPSLETAALIMYDPRAQHPVLYHLYHRIDLAYEIKMIEEINNTYIMAADEFQDQADSAYTVMDFRREQEIIEEILDEEDAKYGIISEL